MRNSIQNTAGFTIIEQAVTVLLIATLVSMACAMYNEYVITTKASEGVHIVMATGERVNTLATRGSCLPSSGLSEQIGLFGDLKVSGTYSAKKGLSCPTGCNATFTFNENAPKELQGKTLSTDILNSGQVSVVSSETSLDAKYYQDDISVIPKKSTDTCNTLPVSANPSNPAGAIAGLETDASTLPQGRALQKPTYRVAKIKDYQSYFDSIVANNPQALIRNLSLDQPQKFYRRANYRIYDPSLFATPKTKGSIMFPNVPTASTYNNGYYNTFITALYNNYNPDYPKAIDIKGYPFIGALADDTVVEVEVYQVYYVDKNNHLILTLLGVLPNDGIAAYYPSITLELVNEEVDAATGNINIILRNISYKLDRIPTRYLTNGWYINYSKTIDLGEVSGTSPPYLIIDWEHSILNKKKHYQDQWWNYDYYEGAYTITLNKS